MKGFSGENEDGREYKRWKTWVKNKFLTLDKLPESSRGAYIYILLSGKALEAVEHLEPEANQRRTAMQFFGPCWTSVSLSWKWWTSWVRFWVRFLAFDRKMAKR